jgi:hypothetical protein
VERTPDGPCDSPIRSSETPPPTGAELSTLRDLKRRTAEAHAAAVIPSDAQRVEGSALRVRRVSEPVLFTTPAMAELFSARALVASMLRVESALALALARADVIPQPRRTRSPPPVVSSFTTRMRSSPSRRSRALR